MPVQHHLEHLAVQFPATELKRVLPPDCDISVDIALFFDTANVSATIARRGIEILADYHAEPRNHLLSVDIRKRGDVCF